MVKFKPGMTHISAILLALTVSTVQAEGPSKEDLAKAAQNPIANMISLPPAATISDVAMAWVFYHLGRFSQQYAQLFNELPRVTVERGRELPL